MRYLCAAFAMLISSAAAASAQSFLVLRNTGTMAAMAPDGRYGRPLDVL